MCNSDALSNYKGNLTVQKKEKLCQSRIESNDTEEGQNETNNTTNERERKKERNNNDM